MRAEKATDQSNQTAGRALTPPDARNNFARADIYLGFRAPAGLVREHDDPATGPFSERHLQCVWFDARHRPAELTTTSGEPVTVENPGRWNLEAGPDFLNASLRLGKDGPSLQGDVEIHIHPEDWKRHQHLQDPAYARVVAHVTYHPGTLPAEALPPGTLQIALRGPIERTPHFFFDAIDTTAYPYAAWPTDGPPTLAHLTLATDRLTLLHAAGEERLRRRTSRLQGLVQHNGLAQTLYEELAASLGYKQNEMAFRRLAHTLPLQQLRAITTNASSAYALLCGVSGLLPADKAPGDDDATRAFLRSLWDTWWKLASLWSGQPLPADAWHLSGMRPQNHPLRRLAALAAYTDAIPQWPPQTLDAPTPDARSWIHDLLARLDAPDPSGYWSHHLSLRTPAHPQPCALVGRGRRMAMVTNIFLPLRAARGQDITGLYHHLPPEQDNQKMRAAANALFGRDHNPSLYNRDGLAQQGLIQIFHDHLLNHRPDCHHTPPLPALPISLSLPSLEPRRPRRGPPGDNQ